MSFCFILIKALRYVLPHAVDEGTRVQRGSANCLRFLVLGKSRLGIQVYKTEAKGLTFELCMNKYKLRSFLETAERSLGLTWRCGGSSLARPPSPAAGDGKPSPHSATIGRAAFSKEVQGWPHGSSMSSRIRFFCLCFSI